jgi:SAM-dependent methyltransferase
LRGGPDSSRGAAPGSGDASDAGDGETSAGGDERTPASGVGLGTAPVRGGRTSPEWVREHYHQAAQEVVDFFAAAGADLAGKDVADVGAGDGLIDLGVVHKAAPARLVGFDIVPTDTGALLELARRDGIAEALPDTLEFRASEPSWLPADDGSFDFVFSWSTFEHVAEPLALLREIRRVLRPGGILMIQVWPFFHSRHGSHLWQYFAEGFVQLLHDGEEIEARVRRDPGPDPEWAERLLAEYRSCNEITLDGLQGALQAARFTVRRLEVLSHTVAIPEGLEHYPLSMLGVAGAKLLATPR